MRCMILCAATCTTILTSAALGQDTLDRPLGEDRQYRLDSGTVRNVADAPAVVFSETIHIQDAAWIRLFFKKTDLATGSYVRVISALDGQMQKLDADAMAMWHNSTAYFNGNTVTVELIASSQTRANRLVIDHVAMEIGQGMPAGSCGICRGDDRERSEQDFAARLLPAGCSSTVWNTQSCVVSAGHCIGGDNVIQFRVPDSNPDCTLNHPPVDEQFPITEVIFSNNGVGDDWSVLAAGTNDLGQTPFQRYELFRPVSETIGAIGQTLECVGYGIDSQCERSQVQQASTGEIQSVNSGYYTYDVDTTFGNSGSGVHLNGEILAIATHCDCPNNIGTRLDFAPFAAARQKMCPPGDCPDLTGDGVVGAGDLATLLGQWGPCPGCPADLDGSGDVGSADLAILLGFWGACGE